MKTIAIVMTSLLLLPSLGTAKNVTPRTPGEKPGRTSETTRELVEEVKVGMAANQSSYSQRSGTANSVDATANAEVVVENCTGACQLPVVISDVVYGDSGHALSAEAMSNATTLAAKAAAYVEQGVSGEQAMTTAANDMQLNPEKIRENCGKQ